MKPGTSYSELMKAAALYVAEEKPRVDAPDQAAALLRPLMAGREQEAFYVLSLNTRHAVVDVHLATLGLADRSQVHAREVFRRAIVCNACKVVLAHNHPSGDPTPSAHDIACTRSLVEAGKIIGVEVVDHVIIGTKTPSRPRDFLSFREEGLM